jgi:2-alkyl-3-oxoalkanoate reductase
METLVTGAAGFVGYHLVSALRKRGDNVRAFVLPSEDSSRLEQIGALIYRGDVCHPETLREAIVNVDTVFHLAAIHGLWRPKQEYYAVNVGGTENVCKAALASGVRRFIYVSSWTVYGMGLGKPVDESFPLKPIEDVYTITKAEAEKLVQGFIERDHLPAVTVRPGTMFGPGDFVNFGRMVERLRNGRAIIIGSGNNAVPFVYVSDVVDGMILAANEEQALSQAYNLCTDQPMTQIQLWSAIAQDTGNRMTRLRVPYFLLYALASVAERVYKTDDSKHQPLVTRLGIKLFGDDNRHVIDKAHRELGYVPKVPIREGVRITANWYNQLAQRPSGAAK